MKKYNTRPIDYTGCHPVIAEHLKRGEAIECFVGDFENLDKAHRCFVIGFACSEKYKYTTEGHEHRYVYAEPVPLKTRHIMPPERAIRVLIAEGWEFNEYGDLVCPGEVIPASAFRCFGRPYDDYEAFVRFWPPCIIEEVEDDE